MFEYIGDELVVVLAPNMYKQVSESWHDTREFGRP